MLYNDWTVNAISWGCIFVPLLVFFIVLALSMHTNEGQGEE